MIELNPQYEAIFSADNIDDDCDKIAHEVDVVGMQIEEILKIASEIDDGRVGLYRMAVTKYLQLLKSMTKHFVDDEHWCHFDDIYCPEYSLQAIYGAIRRHRLDADSAALLQAGHDEIRQTEAYNEYGIPLYIHRIGQ